MKKIYVVCFAYLIMCSCKSSRETVNLKSGDLEQNWYQKDYNSTNTPGISLEKWYGENGSKAKKTIIVAVIDTQIDKNHEDLKNKIWLNSKEIPDNNLDDDQNGYIDDIQGWNFTAKNDSYVVWGNFEYVRLVRELQGKFENKADFEISKDNMRAYKEYLRAKKSLENQLKYYKNKLKSQQYSKIIFPIAKDSLKRYFPKEDYTYEQLDSLYKIHKINDKTFRQRREDDDRDLGAMIGFMKFRFDQDEKTLADVIETEIQTDSIVNKNLNLDFNERSFIGDNPNVLEKGYGSKYISISKKGHRSFQDHNTKVSGIIVAERNNAVGINGIVDNVKIMPLTISYSGDEHDKDIAMAVYYAVDNGAKVINLSFIKEFSLKQDWVSEAFRYAEKNNVLIVHAAGNESLNVDENPVYPSDNNFDGFEDICNNFINVGSISNRLDNTFVSRFSNYGKKNVDLFAPGEDIYTTASGNTYKFDSGTSLAAPMVSGTAALIWSYYPKLTVHQVKQIILDSGTVYNLEVLVPGTKDKKVPFSELSKSGKVLNVYNAMSLAKKVNRNKNDIQ
ncbi:S8 family serine peptidase [Flavobacterium foetidum]|uniref:S8 family serine peptidase n=1 Tax=Flavobacterium foetidum TaxID=2026681 RepID=UPI0010752B1D|nr:S8 family serine peptidase [Flavobacterium foetidum]KAF2516658.1 S8 family serine peptidase [Flavobacterium foetidum]